ncbi:thrombospondin 2/3/4/5 [Mytilus galloprovincialis]|uniref:Thrombospondin 2/3/4/5 n=1 Tax=Mytilus galloprovincialis TaxID=29158 RepID=A0A8B6H8F8_MYTGA|nr:thrombospondin 2/3/4/5 [Mytilus galloprovincialis]
MGYLQDNRITRIESGAFQDVRANTLNFYNNKLRVIESNAFTTVHADTFSFTGNLVREIQSHAFNGTSCSYFYMQNMNLGVIPSYAFTDFTCGRVDLQSSSITDIKKHAFYNFRVNYNLYLYNNQLNTISSSIFGGTSYVKYLKIYNNGLTSITSDGFRNVDVDYIYLQNNGLTVYPIALNEITPLQIYLNNNEISVIPTGSFVSQTRLQHLYMFNNNVEQISSGLLPPATNLRTIDFHENQIQYIEEGSFTGLTSLQTLDLGQNVIPYFPSVILPAIRTLDLADNRIEALGVLNLGGSVNLDNNFLGCECSTVESLYNVKDGLSANTMCYSPTALQGVLFASSQSSSPNHFTKKDVALFQCSGENITGTVVSSTNITITLSRPSYLYYLFNTSNDEIVAAEKVTNNIETWEYLVTCTSNTAATLTKIQTIVLDFSECIIDTPCNTTADTTTVTSSTSTSDDTTYTSTAADTTYTSTAADTTYTPTAADTTYNHITECSTIDPNCIKSTDHTTSVSFSDEDGLRPLTLYECVIQLTVDNYTSAKSVPTLIFTQAAVIAGTKNETTENNVTTNTKDINMDMTFYDFSAGYDDFSSTSGILSVSPFQVTSPLGSWLSISSDPTVDTFSEWFRSASSNVVVEGGITLSYDDSIITSDVRRYYTSSFFPVDNSGYGAEGQTDCGGTLHNFAFTSALRCGITFSGSEVITLGGGEELWLFINKILVVEIVKNRTISDVPCQKIDLSEAIGGGYVIPEEGVLINGDCVGLSPLASSTVYVELVVGETYPFEIFHAERHPCTSELFIQFENVDLPENGSLPFNYHLTPREDLHVNGIVGIFNIWDIFATGSSFQVELISGNEARHFTLKEDTIANRNAATTVIPPTYEYVFVKGTNVSYVECASKVMIPEPSTPGTEMFTISTSQVLLTLVTELDYAVEQTYTLTLGVADTGSGLTGSLIIRVSVQDVNDNCPSLTSISYITPRPILQLDPLFSVQSQDSDSGINAETQVYISPVMYESPPVDYTNISDIRRQVYNGSTELTLEIIGIDQGTPPRGSAVNVTVNISNTCLIDEWLDRTNMLFTVNQSSGDVYLRIPGYWVINYTCSDYIGIYNGLIRDDQMSASSSRSKLTLPVRARLGNNASDPVFGPLAGGWVAGTNDLDQYIEVNMEEFYQIKQIHLQGQQDEANWVTSFRVYYVDNTAGNWTLYKNDGGEFIFLGNNDQDTIRTTDLNPPIVAQYIRINPRNWTNNIGLRMELSGCPLSLQYYYDTSCERCYTSSYCLGDGETHMCGRCENGTDPCDRSPTEHSFGAQSECLPCLDGWICKDGYATPCADYTYVLGCNDTYCPDTCTLCEPGYACRGGQRYVCLPGTYSKGTDEFCSICTQGLYQDEAGQSECKKCPAGYYSSKSKDRCNACDVGSYSLGDGKVGCIACASTTECPCMGNTACFQAGGSRAGCINKGAGSYECLDCPAGFIGDGVTCADIDECALHHPCWNTSACINTVPGYQCLACPYGYTGTYEDGLAWNNTVRVFELMNQELAPLQEQICVDINECLTDNGRCDPLSPCVNTIGSYYCGFCSEGYAGIPSINCYSSNYCQTGQHTCSQYASCIYLGPGEYSCECDIGYTGTGKYCGLDQI